MQFTTGLELGTQESGEYPYSPNLRSDFRGKKGVGTWEETGVGG